MTSAEKVGHCEERGDERDYRHDRAERRYHRVLRLLIPLVQLRGLAQNRVRLLELLPAFLVRREGVQGARTKHCEKS